MPESNRIGKSRCHARIFSLAARHKRGRFWISIARRSCSRGYVGGWRLLWPPRRPLSAGCVDHVQRDHSNRSGNRNIRPSPRRPGGRSELYTVSGSKRCFKFGRQCRAHGSSASKAAPRPPGFDSVSGCLRRVLLSQIDVEFKLGWSKSGLATKVARPVSLSGELPDFENVENGGQGFLPEPRDFEPQPFHDGAAVNAFFD